MTDIGALSKDVSTEGYMRSSDKRKHDMQMAALKHKGKWNSADENYEIDADLFKFKKGTQAVKVPKYKKGTRYKTC
jgi:hypothetical protein